MLSPEQEAKLPSNCWLGSVVWWFLHVLSSRASNLPNAKQQPLLRGHLKHAESGCCQPQMENKTQAHTYTHSLWVYTLNIDWDALTDGAVLSVPQQTDRCHKHAQSETNRCPVENRETLV